MAEETMNVALKTYWNQKLYTGSGSRKCDSEGRLLTQDEAVLPAGSLTWWTTIGSLGLMLGDPTG